MGVWGCTGVAQPMHKVCAEHAPTLVYGSCLKSLTDQGAARVDARGSLRCHLTQNPHCCGHLTPQSKDSSITQALRVWGRTSVGRLARHVCIERQWRLGLALPFLDPYGTLATARFKKSQGQSETTKGKACLSQPPLRTCFPKLILEKVKWRGRISCSFYVAGQRRRTTASHLR